MKKYFCLFILFFPGIFSTQTGWSQEKETGWKLRADQIDPGNYYGITVANGMIGIISSTTPFKVKDVVLNGAYDSYGRGRVSNILKGFNFVDMRLEVDSVQLDAANITHFQQVLDMHRALLTTSFEYQDKVSVKYVTAALRQLPFTALVEVEITAKKDVEIMPSSVMRAPDLLRDVQNYYNEIDRPKDEIHLLTSTALSPTGKLFLAASTSFIFPETHGNQPEVIHEMWDNNMHLMKFRKKLKAGQTYRFSVVGSTITSAQHSDPLNEAERLTIFAALQGSKCA